MTPRIPPQSVESEQSVIGALLMDPRALAKVADVLSEDDFYRRDHRLIYQAILELDAHGKPFDVVTVGDWIAERGQAGMVENGAYVVQLATSVPGSSNVMAYAEQVRERAIRRRLIDVGNAIMADAYEPEGRKGSELADIAIRELMGLSKAEQKHDFGMREAARMAWDDAQEASQHPGDLRGIPSGYARIDARLGGWHKGDLVFIGARPSMGKTALMVNLALNAAATGHSVGMVSGEQSVLQIGQRSIAMTSGVAAERMRNGNFQEEDWPHLDAGMRKLLERKVRIYDRSAPTLDEIGRTARRWVQEYGAEILFVDYLQRIRVPRAENRIAEVSEVARGLKTLARDLDIPVVALAQVKAEVDSRSGDKRPNLGDIANSDEATREADQIAFLYRDEVYNPNTNDKGVAELNVEKNRHGPTGRFRLRFDGATMRFADFAGAHLEAVA